jgi:hypothetical protein
MDVNCSKAGVSNSSFGNMHWDRNKWNTVLIPLYLHDRPGMVNMTDCAQVYSWEPWGQQGQYRLIFHSQTFHILETRQLTSSQRSLDIRIFNLYLCVRARARSTYFKQTGLNGVWWSGHKNKATIQSHHSTQPIRNISHTHTHTSTRA